MNTRQPLAIVRLDIGPKEEQIYVYEGDDVEILVQYFCERHDLGQECLEFITGQVNQEIKLQRKKSESPIVKYSNLKGESLRSFIQQKILEHHYSKIQKNKHKKMSSIYDKLHDEANEIQYNREIISEKTREDDDIKTMQGVSFQPQVSTTNDVIVSKLKRNQTQIDVCNYLYEESVNMRQRKRFAIESRLKEIDSQSKSPNFSTVLSQISFQRLQNNKLQKSQSAYTIHERLFREAKEKSKNRVIENSKAFNFFHPFKPQISKSPKYEKKSFIKKEKFPKYPKIEKIQENHQFQPQVNHDAYWIRAGRKKDMQDKVIAQQIKIGKLRLNSNNRFAFRKPNKNKQDVKNEYNKDLEQRLIQDVFLLLDSDTDGFISANYIELRYINLRVLECIASVLVEMEEHGTVLNSQQFYASCLVNGIAVMLVQELIKDRPYPRYDQSKHDYERILHKIKF